MKKIMSCLSLASTAFLLGFPVSSAFAVTVSSSNSAWVLLPGSVGPNTGTWALPANLSSIGCGVENEPSCEPTGHFVVSEPFAIGGPGYYTIVDANGVDDMITVANTMTNGVIEFFSDPNLPPPPNGYAFLGTLCNETSGNGCFGTFSLLTAGSGTTLTISPASDQEATFDPFGFHFDSSDQIRFTGATPVGTVPEPATLTLLALGAIGLAARRRKRSV